MTWNTHFLKFPDEAAWLAVAPAEYDPAELALDVVGTLYRVDGEAPTPVEGFHVNVRCVGELPEALTPYEIDVANPKRVFL